MDLIPKLFDVLFPVFLIIGIGYWFGKRDPKFDTKFITTFAGNFGLPAIIFYSFTTTNLSIELFLRFSYYITLYVLIFSVIGVIILKILNKDIYRLLPPLILPNTGNMGMPLCLFAYGKTGLAIATAITSVILVFHFSLNILLASKKFSESEINFTSPELAAKSAIMSSFAFYGINFYEEAEENLIRYLKTYPGDTYVMYAHYLLAIIYFEQIADEKNDLKPLLDAREKINFFLKKYPNSEYAIDLNLKKNRKYQREESASHPTTSFF